jgi:hypothetical protein
VGGNRLGVSNSEEYEPGSVVMIGKEELEWRVEFFWQRRVMRVISSTGLSRGLLRRQKRQVRRPS